MSAFLVSSPAIAVPSAKFAGGYKNIANNGENQEKLKSLLVSKVKVDKAKCSGMPLGEVVCHWLVARSFFFP